MSQYCKNPPIPYLMAESKMAWYWGGARCFLLQYLNKNKGRNGGTVFGGGGGGDTVFGGPVFDFNCKKKSERNFRNS